jgi:hydroxymethylglutaryl-CoA synthase
LEVGTETLADHSKSTKTVLLSLFGDNTDIEGATTLNACYGGTAALLNSFLWVESDGWDGRYALVVAADIAAYARGPARPTSGAGAVAILVGRDAPIVFDPRERATHAAHVWDFFKPNPAVEYPVVDGALSQQCYYQALEDVYMRLADKLDGSDKRTLFTAESPDYFCFHSPYNKLVQKSFARLYLLDAVRRRRQVDHASNNGSAEKPTLAMNGHHQEDNGKAEEKKDATVGTLHDEHDAMLKNWLDKPLEETYADRQLEGVLKNMSSAAFKAKLEDANLASKLVGNTYTASIFLGLASLIDRVGRSGELTPGKSIIMFSYGSGALATMYRLKM